ncbi:hypothetical protein WMZ97_10395 [Lentibacillus sp. N15]|uniref:hypothetical protein n=1 Tax=Lentibacillus songyuanensis TaxID=3136161 RepID=UPI0031BA498C
MMRQLLKLTFIGIVAGIVLAVFLKIIQLLTGNQAFVLLFNTDYIPLLRNIQSSGKVGITFHFVTCILSVIVLFYILKSLHLERSFTAYLVVFTVGGGILYSLTALTEQVPAVTDFAAWAFWTIGHAIFASVVGLLIKWGRAI